MTESALMPAPTDFSHTQQPAPSAESAMGTLYRAALGPIRPESYLPRFERFDALGRTQPGWNWAASLCTLNWMALRHLWTPALIYVAAAEGLGLLLFGAIRALLPWPEPVQWGLVGAFALLAFALPGLYGDAILHTEIRKRIARALASTRNLPDACAQLEQQAATPRRLAGLAALNAALLAAAALAFWLLPQTSPADAPAQPPSAAGNVAVGTASAPEIHPIAAPPATPASAPASTPTSTASDAEPTPLHAPAPPAATPPASAPVQQTAAASTPAPKASAPAPKASTAAPKASAPPTMARTPAASSAKPPGPAAPAATRRAASAPAPAASAAPRPTPATTPRKPPPAAAPASSPAQSSSESVPAPPNGASAPAASASDSTTHAPTPSASNAPPPAVGRTPGYYINVGLFAEEANARKAQAKLLNAGLPAFRQSLDTPKGQRIRVRVGPYPSAAQAQAAARSIKALQLDAVVFQQSTSPE